VRLENSKKMENSPVVRDKVKISVHLDIFETLFIVVDIEDEVLVIS